MKLQDTITRSLRGDPNATDEHGRSVGRIAARIAVELGLDESEQDRVRLAASLHDIGKKPIPERILAKPGPLDAEELAAVRLHPVLGAERLDAIGLTDIASWVRSHHERPDGRGYPSRLRGDQIPVEARIIAVADAYDAMVSDRPYSAAISESQACAELAAGAGTQFDADVVEAFMRTRARPVETDGATSSEQADRTGRFAAR